ncbi:glycosyltransferase [Leptolyngbya sp. PCC 7375]|nr:glycosyltransferase [Leptolyngbya sp. PCC 7375]
MNTCFIPKFTSINPYQEKLSQGLERLGIKSEGIEERKPYLPEEIQHRNAQLLHIHWLHEFYSANSLIGTIKPLIKFILGLIIVKLQGIKIIWTAHNIRHHEQKYPLIDRICTLSVVLVANAIIVHSEAAKKELIKDLPFDIAHKAYVIPHANYIEQYQNSISHSEARKQLDIPDSKIVFLFLGLIRPYKGVVELIEAFEELNHPEAFLLIAGKSRDQQLTNTIQAKADTNPAVQFIPGFVADDDIQTYMNAADVVTFPYKNILTSGAVMLAMSFGRACLAPKKDCITEVLDTEGAFLYDPALKAGLLSAMQEAIRKKDLASGMGEYNYRKAKAWDWNHVAKSTLAVYETCLTD